MCVGVRSVNSVISAALNVLLSISVQVSDSSEEESHSRIQEEDREGDEGEEEEEEGDRGDEEGDRGDEEGRMAEDRDDSSYHGNRDVDTSMFEGSTLPVQCGSVVGILQKDRFVSSESSVCVCVYVCECVCVSVCVVPIPGGSAVASSCCVRGMYMSGTGSTD